MSSSRETPPGTVLVTTSWDDGHVLDARIAAMLNDRGMQGTFYVAPENIELEPSERLDHDALVQLAGRFEIGGHTLTHRRLSTLNDDEAFREICDGRSALESILGVAPVSFCYPGGDFTERDVNLVKRAGYTCARTVERWSVDGLTTPYRLPTTVHAYRHLVDGSRAWRLHRGRLRAAAASFFNWDHLAIAMFAQAKSVGGVWHLWGHSWEIAARNDWTRLERVLDHVAADPTVTHVVNGELPFVGRA